MRHGFRWHGFRSVLSSCFPPLYNAPAAIGFGAPGFRALRRRSQPKVDKMPAPAKNTSRRKLSRVGLARPARVHRGKKSPKLKALVCERKAAHYILSTADHLKGAWLKAVAARCGKRGTKNMWFLCPDSEAHRIHGFSITTRRNQQGEACHDGIREKESAAADGAAAQCVGCGVKVGDLYHGKPVTPSMISIDHHTDELDSWESSRTLGTVAAELADGVAQKLCLFCNAKKTPAGSSHYHTNSE